MFASILDIYVKILLIFSNCIAKVEQTKMKHIMYISDDDLRCSRMRYSKGRWKKLSKMLSRWKLTWSFDFSFFSLWLPRWPSIVVSHERARCFYFRRNDVFPLSHGWLRLACKWIALFQRATQLAIALSLTHSNICICKWILPPVECDCRCDSRLLDFFYLFFFFLVDQTDFFLFASIWWINVWLFVVVW